MNITAIPPRQRFIVRIHNIVVEPQVFNIMEEQFETELDSNPLTGLDLGLQTFTSSIHADPRYVCVTVQQRKRNEADERIFQDHYGMYIDNQRWFIPIAFYKGCMNQLNKGRDDIFEVDPQLKKIMETYKTKKINSSLALSLRTADYEELLLDQKHCILQGVEQKGRILIKDQSGQAKFLSSLFLINVYSFDWPILIICNKKQKLNWANQFQNILKIPRNQIQIIDGFQNQVQNVQVTIISFKLCSTFEQRLRDRGYQICMVDSCEKLLRRQLQCTGSCNQILEQCKFKFFITEKALVLSEQQDLMLKYDLKGLYQFPCISQNQQMIRKQEQMPFNQVDGILNFIKQQFEQKKKFVFFAHQKSVLKAVEDYVKRRGIGYVAIYHKLQENQRKLNNFEQNASIRIAIIRYKAVNEKLKLNASEIVFGQIWRNVYGMMKTENWVRNSNMNAYYLMSGDQDQEIYQQIIYSKNSYDPLITAKKLKNDKLLRKKQDQLLKQYI